MPPDGFVVAMRGRLVVAPGSKRHRRAVDAWLIVSRFGPGGLTLAIALAGAAGADAAPPRLAPRQTLLGQRVAAPPQRPGILFQLLGHWSPGLRIAGRWRAAGGFARLIGSPPALRLIAAGRLAAGLRWRIRAAQQPWIGEWHMPGHARLTLP
ncbi:hypothetical protein [Falsiroseomonas selenitidurans]|uniref:Uncharacterized protein n=1 Tax=Falsiroseomonas selenitidurans TaxID=2716335 RepID=A0ABX1E2F5_9PROT|nr:hypothetical protein [Falsiroseomonas selenitidurans]NKC31191.1 hypothetical protein [Falsiroseomonas selenitidurans]